MLTALDTMQNPVAAKYATPTSDQPVRQHHRFVILALVAIRIDEHPLARFVGFLTVATKQYAPRSCHGIASIYWRWTVRHHGTMGRGALATVFATQLLGIGWQADGPGGVTKSHKVASFLATDVRCVSPKLKDTPLIVQAFARPPARRHQQP